MTPRPFAWQARHKLTSTVVLRGRRGTNSHLSSFCVAGVAQMALGGALGLGLGARQTHIYRAGAAQTHIYHRFAWQARHKLTSTVVLRGRRGMAGVAQTHIYRRFAWQAWHRWHWVARLDLVWARVTLRHFAWQGRHKLTSTVVLRGRCGTNSHLPSFCVAGVAEMALGGTLGLGFWARVTPRHFAWQARHKLTSTVVLRGRCGTDGTGWRAWTWFGRA